MRSFLLIIGIQVANIIGILSIAVIADKLHWCDPSRYLADALWIAFLAVAICLMSDDL